MQKPIIVIAAHRRTMMITMIHQSNSSQAVPQYPAGQRHPQSPSAVSKHVPPLRHGLAAHPTGAGVVTAPPATIEQYYIHCMYSTDVEFQNVPPL